MLREEELPPGFDSGSTFTSVCINTSLYLPYLVSQCLKNGVIFERRILDHISVAKSLHHSGEPADVVVNCTGISARKLGGVMDQNMMPARGQTVLVRNTADVMCDVLGIETGDEEVCYVMQRAAGGLNFSTCLWIYTERGNRWWYTAWRLLPKRQLGFAGRPKPRNPHHETRH